MAWTKEITCERTGIVASHWDTISVFYKKREQMSDLIAGGWVSKAAYDAGKEPVMIRNWFISSGLAPDLAAGADQFISDFAKAQAEFAGWTTPE